jgi:hypothetical protein
VLLVGMSDGEVETTVAARVVLKRRWTSMT